MHIDPLNKEPSTLLMHSTFWYSARGSAVIMASLLVEESLDGVRLVWGKCWVAFQRLHELSCGSFTESEYELLRGSHCKTYVRPYYNSNLCNSSRLGAATPRAAAFWGVVYSSLLVVASRSLRTVAPSCHSGAHAHHLDG